MGTCLHTPVFTVLVIAILTLFLLPGDTNAQINFGGSNSRSIERPPRLAVQNRQEERPPRLAVQNRRYQASPCPGNEDFCTIAEDFPSNLINEFGNFTVYYPSSPDLDLGVRSGFEEEIRACDVRRSRVLPRKARNLKGEFMFILNSKDFQQAIQIERCIEENQPCLLDEDAPNPGSTSCKQQYASYQLYAVNENGTSIVETFRLPSACTCYHKEVGLNLERNGFDRINTRQTEIVSPICNQTVQDFDNGIGTRIVNTNINRNTNNNINKNRNIRKLPYCINTQLRSGSSDRVFFPDAQSNRRTRKPPKCQKYKPKRCKTGTVCENTEDYPEDIVRESLQRLSNTMKGLYLKKACLDPLETLGVRQFFTEEIQLCQSVNRIIVPTSGQNIRCEWKTIVNIPGYTQTINVEECGESSNSCTYSGTFGKVPEQTNCQQLYREHNMLTLNEETLEIEEDVIKIPSACACFYRKDYNPSFLLRRGEKILNNNYGKKIKKLE